MDFRLNKESLISKETQFIVKRRELYDVFQQLYKSGKIRRKYFWYKVEKLRSCETMGDLKNCYASVKELHGELNKTVS